MLAMSFLTAVSITVEPISASTVCCVPSCSMKVIFGIALVSLCSRGAVNVSDMIGLMLAGQFQQFGEHGIRRFAAGVERRIGLGVERLSALQDRDEVVHRAWIAAHGTQIA